MSRHCVARMVIACILYTLLGAAWFPCEAQQKQILRIKGSNAMANVTDRIAAEFMNVNPKATVLVTGGGSDAGFEALFEKQADLVMASRNDHRERGPGSRCESNQTRGGRGPR